MGAMGARARLTDFRVPQRGDGHAHERWRVRSLSARLGLVGPRAEPSEDQFGTIRFTVPRRQGGRYRDRGGGKDRLDAGGSDADFHVLHNDTKLFGGNVEPVSAAGYTNELTWRRAIRLISSVAAATAARNMAAG